VEGLAQADPAEHLACAADLAGLGILQHEDEQVALGAVLGPRQRLVGAGQLGDQCALVGGQVGEPAAGQLGHLVDRLEILRPCRAHPEAHRPSPLASRKMVSADNCARSARLAAIRNSLSEWIAPPRTPIVSTTGTPQAAILLPSHTPPV